jgi:hypothetical protein
MADPNAAPEWKFRTEHLLEPRFNSIRDRSWGRKMLQALAMTSLSARSEATIRLLNKCRGFSIRLGHYVSRIDGTTQYYLYYKADSGTTPRPLIVILPAVQSTVRRFLESPTLAYIKGLEAFASVADEVGVDLLWPGFCNVDYGGQLCQKEASECLANITLGDVKRPIYLFGECSSGLAAIAVANSGINFDGILLHDPILHRRTLKWMAQIPSFATIYPPSVLLADNARLFRGPFDSAPIRIVCDTNQLGHSDVPGTLALEQGLRAAGKDVKAYWESPPFHTMPWGQRTVESLRVLFQWAKEAVLTARGTPGALAGSKASEARTVKEL